jgi:integrase/recombinase XerC
MTVAVKRSDGSHRLDGTWAGIGLANAFLSHLEARRFSPATVRAYAFDIVCLARFLEERGISLGEVVPTDVFDWIDWQSAPRRGDGKVVLIGAGRGAAPASVNRRVAAARALFEYLVLTGAQAGNPVPAPRRGQGLRPKSRGLLGHLGPGRVRGGGRLVRQERRLPESLDPADVSMFLAGLGSHRDRAVVLAMVLGGLRAGEVRRLLLADVDQGRRQLRVVGKGGRERVVPVDDVFFAELAAYLARERPPGLGTPECFVVLHGPAAGGPLTEAGMRSMFRYHRQRSGAVRVRPHRLRHTYGTELEIGRVASDATFPGKREQALPAAQRAALRCPRPSGPPRGCGDLGLHGLPGSDATMMKLIPLRGPHHHCACRHRDASGSSLLHRVHHRLPQRAAPVATAAGRDALDLRIIGRAIRRTWQLAALVAPDASPLPETDVRAAASSPVSHAARRPANALRTWPPRIAVGHRRTLMAWTCDAAGQIRTRNHQHGDWPPGPRLQLT